MGSWLTHEERLAYHRDYQHRYRKEHPEKFKMFYKTGRSKKLEKEQKKELEERENARATFLLDEYDEGVFI